jgi:hypothetical protein
MNPLYENRRFIQLNSRFIQELGQFVQGFARANPHTLFAAAQNVRGSTNRRSIAMKRFIDYVKSPEGLLLAGLAGMVIGVSLSLAHALTRLY